MVNDLEIYRSGECIDGEWKCQNGDCIPQDYYCDGDLQNGNAWYPPDCKDGSDEILIKCCAEKLYEKDFCLQNAGSK